jgi:hypothetical protein
MVGSLIGKLLSSAARGIGKLADNIVDDTGSIGASIDYLTGKTGRLLKEGAEESIRRNGRILNREEQARGLFNRTVLRGEIVRKRMTSAGSFFLQGRLATPTEPVRAPFLPRVPRRFTVPLTPMPEVRPGMAIPKSPPRPIAREMQARAFIDPRYRTNTTKYEKALASRSRARKFLFGRVAPAAGLIGGGYIGGAVMRNITEQRKAFYGEEMYASRYGEGGERAASLIENAGLVFGVGAALGITPVSGVARFGKKMFGRRGFITGARLGIRSFTRQIRDRGRVTRSMRYESQKETMRQVKTAPIPGQYGPMRVIRRIDETTTLRTFAEMKKRYPLFNVDEVMAPGTGTIDSIPSRVRARRARRRARKEFDEEFEPHMTGTSRPARRQREVKSQRRDRQRQRLESEAAEGAYRESLARDRFSDILRAEKAPIKEAFRQRMKRGGAKGYGHEENVKKLTTGLKERAKTGRKNAMKLLKANQNFLGPITATAVGVGAAGLTLGLTLGAEPTTIAATAAAGLAIKSAGFIKRHPAGVALTAATLTSGAAIGMNITPSPAAEGNIEEIVPARQSAVRRLNYSTAGLVQSIHNNRRM